MTPNLSTISRVVFHGNMHYPYITVFLQNDPDEWLLKRSDLAAIVRTPHYFSEERPPHLKLIAANNDSTRFISTILLICILELI